MRTPEISRVHVVPDYGRGFVYHWEVAGDFCDPGPWEFLVQAAESQSGDWRDISPVLSNVFAYRAKGPVRVGKAFVLYFRVLMRTPNGVYESGVVSPYGDLDRREFLMGRDIMRMETLHHRKLGGVEIDVWSSSTWGPRCDCRDPVTGHVRDSKCPKCLGTGYAPPYHGPFRVWGAFSTDAQHQTSFGEGGDGVTERKPFSIDLVASVPMKKGDVVKDVRSGKMYHVDSVAVKTEIRRVPLLQQCSVMEAAATDPVYMVEDRNG